MAFLSIYLTILALVNCRSHSTYFNLIKHRMQIGLGNSRGWSSQPFILVVFCSHPGSKTEPQVWGLEPLYKLEKNAPQQKTPRPHTQHTQTYIQASTQNRAEAILTSIYIKQSRRIPTKAKQTPLPNSTPKYTTAKTYYLI